MPKSKVFPNTTQTFEVKLQHPPNIEKSEIIWTVNDKIFSVCESDYRKNQVLDGNTISFQSHFSLDDNPALSNHKLSYNMPETYNPDDKFLIAFTVRNLHKERKMVTVARPKIPVDIKAEIIGYNNCDSLLSLDTHSNSDSSILAEKTAKVKIDWEFLGDLDDVLGFTLEMRPLHEKELYPRWTRCGEKEIESLQYPGNNKDFYDVDSQDYVTGLITDATSIIVNLPLPLAKNVNHSNAPEFIFRVFSHNSGGPSHASEPSNPIKLLSPLTCIEKLPEQICIDESQNETLISVQMNRNVDARFDSLPIWRLNSQIMKVDRDPDDRSNFYKFKADLKADAVPPVSFPATLELYDHTNKLLAKTILIKEPPTFTNKLPDSIEVNESDRATFHIQTSKNTEVIWRINNQILDENQLSAGFEIVNSDCNKYLMIEEASLDNEGEISATIVETGELCSTFLYVNPNDDEDDEILNLALPPTDVTSRRVSFAQAQDNQIHEYTQAENTTTDVDQEQFDTATSATLSESSSTSSLGELPILNTPDEVDSDELENTLENEVNESDFETDVAEISSAASTVSSESSDFENSEDESSEELTEISVSTQPIDIYSSTKHISSNNVDVKSTSIISITALEDIKEVSDHQMLVGFGEDTSLEVFQEQEIKGTSSIKDGTSYSSSGYHKPEPKDSKPLDEVEVPLEDIMVPKVPDNFLGVVLDSIIQKKLAEDEGEEKPKSEEQTNETVQKSEEPTKIPKNFMEVVMDSMIQKSLIEETENKPTETTTQELLVGFGEDTSLEVFQEQEVKAVSSIKQGVSYSSSGYHVSGDDVNKELKDPKLDEVEVPLEDIIPEPEIQKIEPEPTENFTSQAHHERIREEENLEEEEPDFDEVEYVVDEEDLRDRTWAEPIIEAPASLKNTLVLPAGEVLELVAAFDGNPMPSLLWKFNDVMVWGLIIRDFKSLYRIYFYSLTLFPITQNLNQILIIQIIPLLLSLINNLPHLLQLLFRKSIRLHRQYI